MTQIINFTGQAQSIAPGNRTAAAGTSATLLSPAIPFGSLPPNLRGMGTRMVYLDPLNNMHNVAGPNKGIEGTRIATQVYGDQQWHFSQVLVNSPYIFGAQIMRQNIPERKFNFGIIIGSQAPPMNEWQFREAEEYWWAGQDESNDGWFGVYTRKSGWRWIPVRPDETVKTPQKMDATAFGNNATRYDITWIAQRPFFTKPARYLTFQSANSGTVHPAPAGLAAGITPAIAADDYYWGALPIANAGDLPSYVTYYASSPGQAIVQDNSSSRLVPLPATLPSVGTYMCDSEPGHRTLTAANDPQSNLIFDLVRQSQILEYFLGAVAGQGTPLQLQFQNRFMYSIPPKTATTLTVAHSDPNGVIVAVVPQRYKRSR